MRHDDSIYWSTAHEPACRPEEHLHRDNIICLLKSASVWSEGVFTTIITKI